MAFTLEVQFTGLCLHVKHPTRPAVAVLMPDGRLNGPAPGQQRDDTPNVPHVGYLRVDLANVPLADGAATLPRGHREGPDGTDDGPFFEVVYRLARQQLDFGLPPVAAGAPGGQDTPDVAPLGTALRLLPDLFKPKVEPDTFLLFRTVLHGGAFAVSPDVNQNEKWMLDGRFNEGDTAPIVRNFPGAITWTREVDDQDDLDLTISNFDDTAPVRLRLQPVDGPDGNRVIRLKIANLCSDNPLEWEDFQLHGVTGEDSDFKWLYWLFEPASGTWSDLLGEFVLPAPRLMTRHPERFGQAGDCAGGGTKAAFRFF